MCGMVHSEVSGDSGLCRLALATAMTMKAVRRGNNVAILLNKLVSFREQLLAPVVFSPTSTLFVHETGVVVVHFHQDISLTSAEHDGMIRTPY